MADHPKSDYRIVGALTHREAMAQRHRLTAALAAGCRRVDFAGLTHFDSSALAVILAALRARRADQPAIELVGLPDPLLGLARLYGLEDLLRAAIVDGQATGAGERASGAMVS